MPQRALLILSFFATGCSSEIPLKGNIENGATRVPIVSTIRVPLADGTDPASVAADSATLTQANGLPLRGSASFDPETSLLTFAPVRPMTEGTTYTLSSNLVGQDGVPIELSFTTLENPLFRSIIFQSGTGNPDSYSEADGDRTLFFGDSGADRLFFTADDPVGGYEILEPRVGDTQRSVGYGLGPDLVPFTADDEATSYRDRFFSGPLQVRSERYSTGADRLVGTADDAFDQLRQFAHNSEGLEVEFVLTVDRGDGVLGSADDLIVRVIRSVYDSRGLLERVVGVEAGPDGELYTADDVVPDGPPQHSYDERGIPAGFVRITNRGDYYADSIGVVYREDFFDPGADGVINTLDDALFQRFEYSIP